MKTTTTTSSDLIFRLFLTVPDHRVKRTRVYPLPMLLFCALGAFICGGESFHAMSAFAECYRDLIVKLFGVEDCPSHDTFNALFVKMNKEAFGNCLIDLSKKLGELMEGAVIAIDGKSCRRDRNMIDRAAHIVSAGSPGSQLTLVAIAVKEKSNEIPAVPDLIKLLGTSIKNSVVTADVLNAQRATAEVIIKNKADYILAIKENQSGLLSEIRPFLDDLANREPAAFESIDKGHGRFELRKCWQTVEINWLPSKDKWPGLKSISVIDRETENLVTHQKSYTRCYFISSLDLGPKRIAESVREDCGVESSCHWILDVIFAEDRNRVRIGNVAGNLRILRSLAMKLLSKAKQQQKKQISMRTMRFKAALNQEFLCSILSCPYGEEITEQQ